MKLGRYIAPKWSAVLGNTHMRILFSFTGGSGHFLPTTVFARALERRGHEIRYACQDGMIPTVRAAGWEAESTGGKSLSEYAARRPLAGVDRVAEEQVMRQFFADTVAKERAQQLGRLIETWRPDLVVRDEVDFGAALAAEAAGLPHAAIVVIAAGRLTRPEIIGPPLTKLRADLALEPATTIESLHHYLLLVPVPPSFRDPQEHLPVTARFVRPAILDDQETLPCPRRTRTVPRVYFTLGTIFPQESGDLFQRVLAGLASLPIEVTVTVGEAITPAELGKQPPNVRIAPFLPLNETVSRSDLVVSHGGSGTVIAALALGVPQLIFPMGADQPDNADRCQVLNVGLTLDAVTAKPAEIADSAMNVLRDFTYRMACQQIAEEASSLPTTDHAVSLLEALGRNAFPITVIRSSS